jgi:hypothetical protein
VSLGHVVDQLHDKDSLADACAAEETDLATLGVGSQEVDDLDAGNLIGQINFPEKVCAYEDIKCLSEK